VFLLQHLLRRFVEKGRLTVIRHDGGRHAFGSGVDGPDVTVRFHDARVERELFFNPELASAEAYMDGRLTIEGGAIYDLLLLFSVNRRGLGAHPLQQALRKVWRGLRNIHQRNPLGQAAANVRQHYDHPAEFYALWLDSQMNYSCAYFTDSEGSLDAAQQNKLRHVAAKLRLAPGMRVLDIGSGWGALAIYLARTCDARVTALNVSPEQLAASRERARAAGVEDRIAFVEQDYREVAGPFDRVVSIGMMEHVGVAYFDDYFRTVRRLLAPGGFALVHAIGRMSPPGSTAPFIRKYIFPGGYAPALSEVFASTERTGLWVDDCEIWRLHYYWTVRAWRLRFAEKRVAVVERMGERFARMWEFYLGAAELGFLHGASMVFQLLLSERRDDVPVLRDYMLDDERALRAKDASVADLTFLPHIAATPT
jgi:cyclopropane-fatty-acyl-phospholipid synthase